MPRAWACLAMALAAVLTACGQAPRPAHRGSDRSAAGRFSNPTVIDNRWLPLRPGTRFMLSGSAVQDDASVRHTVVFTVTDMTKLIDGVTTLVVLDRDYYAGRLNEEELAFMAQDDAGTVWAFGEYPEERDDGRLAGAPATWIAGVRGARAGVLMPAHPRVGAPPYLEGFAPDIHFADRGRVERAGLSTCVPARCYRDVTMIAEWDPVEPRARQLKYYAPGVGNVRVGFEGGTDHEDLVLRRVVRLDAGALAAARARVATLDRRGYSVKPRVYGRTERAQPLR
jgi:hypothetical protein